MPSERYNHRSPRRSSVIRLLSAILALTSLGPSCSGAPAVPWQEDAIHGAPCDPTTGRCWDLLPAIPDARDNYIVERNELYDRAQPIHARAADQSSDTWPIPESYATEVPSSSGSLKIPSSSSSSSSSINKHTKKDMFMSRGWGAGGMPFSVLYMKPRNNNNSSNNHSPSTGADSTSRKNHPEQSGKKRPPNNNNNNNPGGSSSQQPRRHYSIIPQLFISYGWGPSGK